MSNTEKQRRYELIKVILIGQLWVNVPVILLMIGLPVGIGFWIGEDRLILLFLGGVLAFFVGVFLSWIYWAFLITYWRIWAFEIVHEDDWLRLRTLAKKTKLIWEEGGTYEKLERRNPRQAQQILAIEERLAELAQVALIQLELTTPDQTGYRFNNRGVLPEIVTYLLLWSLIVGLLWTEQYLLAGLLTLVVLSKGWPLKDLPHIFKKEDCLVIDDRGIKTIYPQQGRYDWREMEALAIQKEERKLLIRMFGQDEDTPEVLELRFYRIPNMDLFAQRLEMYVQRYVEGRL